MSEELVVGVEPAALDVRVAPRCPPGLAACRCSSVIMVRQMWLVRRRFRHRRASRGVCLLRLGPRSAIDAAAGRGGDHGGDRVADGSAPCPASADPLWTRVAFPWPSTPPSRNHRVPTAGDTPAATPASSLVRPRAVNSQKRRRCSRRATGGRSGDRNAGRPAQSERRRLRAIATPRTHGVATTCPPCDPVSEWCSS